VIGQNRALALRPGAAGVVGSRVSAAGRVGCLTKPPAPLCKAVGKTVLPEDSSVSSVSSGVGVPSQRPRCDTVAGRRGGRGRFVGANAGSTPRHRNTAPSLTGLNGAITVAVTVPATTGALPHQAQRRFTAATRGTGWQPCHRNGAPSPNGVIRTMVPAAPRGGETPAPVKR
jgi:hypothetical protein